MGLEMCLDLPKRNSLEIALSKGRFMVELSGNCFAAHWGSEGMPYWTGDDGKLMSFSEYRRCPRKEGYLERCYELHAWKTRVWLEYKIKDKGNKTLDVLTVRHFTLKGIKTEKVSDPQK